MWASGATIEADKCGDEPLVGDGVKQVAPVGARHGRGQATSRTARGPRPVPRSAEQFGSGKVGMMGTGNFNIVLARDQMKDHPFKFGISLLPGMEAGKYASFIGGDLVVIPKGSKRVDDSLAFMHYLLNDTQQVELLRQGAQPDDPHRPEAPDNQYYKAEPLIADVAKALAVGKTPYSLTFFEQINDPAGPWLQQLQRAYYTTDRPRHGHRRRQDGDEGDLLQVSLEGSSDPAGIAAALRPGAPRPDSAMSPADHPARSSSYDRRVGQ